MKKLSKREKTVIHGLSLGLKPKDIAKQFDLNQKTVATYIMRAREKLEIPKNINHHGLVNAALEKNALGINNIDELSSETQRTTSYRAFDLTEKLIRTKEKLEIRSIWLLVIIAWLIIMIFILVLNPDLL